MSGSRQHIDLISKSQLRYIAAQVEAGNFGVDKFIQYLSNVAPQYEFKAQQYGSRGRVSAGNPIDEVKATLHWEQFKEALVLLGSAFMLGFVKAGNFAGLVSFLDELDEKAFSYKLNPARRIHCDIVRKEFCRGAAGYLFDYDYCNTEASLVAELSKVPSVVVRNMILQTMGETFPRVFKKFGYEIDADNATERKINAGLAAHTIFLKTQEVDATTVQAQAASAAQSSTTTTTAAAIQTATMPVDVYDSALTFFGKWSDKRGVVTGNIQDGSLADDYARSFGADL